MTLIENLEIEIWKYIKEENMSKEKDIEKLEKELEKETKKLKEIKRRCKININAQKLRVAGLSYDLNRLKKEV